MYIHEAIAATTSDNPWITRKAWTTMTNSGLRAVVKLMPTDTFDCVLTDGYAQRRPTRGWQPLKADLIANDWIPCECPVLLPGEK